VTIGLLRALRHAGVAVAGAKCGPDYIDPAFHAAATGRPSVNLDSWAMPPELVVRLATDFGNGSDLIVCEAVMGLFDGVPGPSGRTGSSADVAAALGWPVLLVMDISGQSQSAAAIVKGCADYDPRITLAGVVLNRVGSPRHARLATDAIEDLGIPVVGVLPRSNDVALPERHLGLVQAMETADLEERLEKIADFVGQNCHLDTIRFMASRHADPFFKTADCRKVPPPGQRIAVARDAAFSFLYPHLLQGWRDAGAEVHFFSPLADEGPSKACDACWLSGGYPELHAGRLAAARHFGDRLRQFAETGIVHGECGGYMTLGVSLTDAEGVCHAMTGLLGVSTSFSHRKLHLGYRSAQVLADGCFGVAGTQLRGHEFHYASIVSTGEDAPFALVSDAYGNDPTPSGSRREKVPGSFFHIIAMQQ
jgi:cobyrinic acid a,c-diamide synthase